MSNRTICAASLALLLLGLTACSISPYDVPGQVGNYNGSIEQLEEQAILINILRASENAPLGFTQVSQVLGSGSFSTSVGLPTIGIGGGPQGPTQNRFLFGPSISSTGNTNVNLLPLETKEFWLGMLTPLSAETLAFFINQGVSREMLFYLYIQRVELSAAGKPTETETNNPLDPGFAEFSDDLRAALTLGLTAKTTTSTQTVGPPLSASQVSDVNTLLTISKAGLDVVPDPAKDGAYRLQATHSAAAVCFDQARATVDISQRLPDSVTCSKQSPPSQAGGAAPFSYQEAHAPLSIQFYPRSTYDIFRYLGTVVRASLKADGKNVDLTTPESKAYTGSDPLANELFVVQKNMPGAAFVKVKYGPDTYSIPKSATNTIEVLALLRQLVALSTSVNSLPPTGALTTVIP